MMASYHIKGLSSNKNLNKKDDGELTKALVIINLLVHFVLWGNLIVAYII